MAKDLYQYPAYAVKSDDGKNQNQYPAYALKSDDGKTKQSCPNILKPMLPKPAMMAKNQTTPETRNLLRGPPQEVKPCDADSAFAEL